MVVILQFLRAPLHIGFTSSIVVFAQLSLRFVDQMGGCADKWEAIWTVA